MAVRMTAGQAGVALVAAVWHGWTEVNESESAGLPEFNDVSVRCPNTGVPADSRERELTMTVMPDGTERIYIDREPRGLTPVFYTGFTVPTDNVQGAHGYALSPDADAQMRLIPLNMRRLARIYPVRHEALKWRYRNAIRLVHAVVSGGSEHYRGVHSDQDLSKYPVVVELDQEIKRAFRAGGL